MSITDKIAAAGVVGCGGAGFPTHAKLKGTIEHLIINGAASRKGILMILILLKLVKVKRHMRK